MDATYWRIKWFGNWLAGCVGVTLAFFAGFELVEKFLQSADDVHLAANIYMTCIFAAVVIFAAIRQWVTIRKEKYANISERLHNIAHQIRDLNTFIVMKEPYEGSAREYDDFIRDCRIQFTRVLDQIHGVFTSITSTHCRVTLKLIYKRGPAFFMYNMTRDQATKVSLSGVDDERINRDHDPLGENKHFEKIFYSSTKWHFISNDLPNEPGFKCTSFTAYNPDYGKEAPKGIFQSKPWPLPYKSAILCVIRQGKISDFHDQLNPEVLGFLTVDSESRGIFEERWDVPLMFSFADALYTPVRAYLDAQNRAPEPLQSNPTAPIFA